MSVHVIWPEGPLAMLTQIEADRISHNTKGDLYELYRSCSLAVLNSGSVTDNSKEMLENYRDFAINVMRNERGLKIELINPPASSVVDGEIIKIIRDHLYAVLRDIVQIKVYQHEKLLQMMSAEEVSEQEITSNYVFLLLRNAGVMRGGLKPNLAVCWGGHAIEQDEYDYAYRVGFALGLRCIDICTGCGPGIMEAPMKGSLTGHCQQGCVEQCRLIGLTEPSIIAAEPPNSMITDLVILPDIEKRLEAFVRLGHTMIIFPGGPGTAEELLFILCIKMHPDNRYTTLPLILTGNERSKDYFDALERFLIKCFGEDVTRFYTRITDDPETVAQKVKQSLKTVRDHRTLTHDSYSFNWSLNIPWELQKSGDVTHESMAALNLHREQEPWKLAAALRSAFSGIVAGNVKEKAARLVAERGPFKLHGDKDIIESMAGLMKDFIEQGRILIEQRDYKPCYEFEAD
ncbi:MAG: LOG family protein [Succinivibrio sp.]|nr:LOG family protein [Succinivibrio sp.]